MFQSRIVVGARAPLRVALALGGAVASAALALGAPNGPSLLTPDVLPRPLGAAGPAQPAAIDYEPTGSVKPGAKPEPAAIQPELPPEDAAGPPSFGDGNPALVLSGLIETASREFAGAEPRVSPTGAADWRAAREAILRHYQARGFAPIWTDVEGLSPSGRQALLRLQKADEDGLDLARVIPPGLARAKLEPAARARLDVAVSAAVVAYALQASGGRIAPGRLSADIAARPAIADPTLALAKVAAADDPGAALESFNPPQAGYRALRAALRQLRAARAQAGAALNFAGPDLRLGMVDPRVAALRSQLAMGAPVKPGDALVYDQAVAAAVAAYQKSRGIAADGTLNGQTEVALSGGDLAAEEAIVVANMEMWRWEPRDMGETRVEVNIPDFSLRVMNGDTEVHRARVIVGKPLTPTPIFSDFMRYVLLNPSWEVPESIIKKEMLPRLAKDPDYLKRMGFEVKGDGDKIVVRQPPGETNALGRILFMFPNDHAVYLHDTPARSLFSLAQRALSHGCVRVDQPMELGQIVLGGPALGWSRQRLAAMVGGDERSVFLPRPLAIHLEYFTAFVDGANGLQLRADIYGFTKAVADSLFRKSQG